MTDEPTLRLTPEQLATLREAGQRFGTAVTEALVPLGDAVTAVLGPRVAADLERQAAETESGEERVRLRRRAAEASAAATRAWLRLDDQRREAHQERGHAARERGE